MSDCVDPAIKALKEANRKYMERMSKSQVEYLEELYAATREKNTKKKWLYW